MNCANFWTSVSNFKSFSRSLWQFFFIQGNKIPFIRLTFDETFYTFTLLYTYIVHININILWKCKSKLFERISTFCETFAYYLSFGFSQSHLSRSISRFTVWQIKPYLLIKTKRSLISILFWIMHHYILSGSKL